MSNDERDSRKNSPTSQTDTTTRQFEHSPFDNPFTWSSVDVITTISAGIDHHFID